MEDSLHLGFSGRSLTFLQSPFCPFLPSWGRGLAEISSA